MRDECFEEPEGRHRRSCPASSSRSTTTMAPMETLSIDEVAPTIATVYCADDRIVALGLLR